MSLISVNQLTISYENSAEPVFENLNLQLDSSWKLGITARNGKGKTTFFKALCQEIPYSGTIATQESFIRFPAEIAEETDNAVMAVAEGYHLDEIWKLYRELDLMKMNEDLLEQSYASLSEGEKVCFQICGLFAAEAGCMLLDEPTNHLDTQARRKITAYLQQKDHFLLASHDRSLLDACCDHILAFNKDSTEVVQGTFSDWYTHKQRRIENQKTENLRLKKEIGQLEASSAQKTTWSARVEASKNGKASSGLKKDKGFVSHKAAKMARRAKNLERQTQRSIEARKDSLKDVEDLESLKISSLPFYKDQLLYADQYCLWYPDSNAPLFEPVTFDIRSHQKVLLQGPNGAGKSTLLHQLLTVLRQNNPSASLLPANALLPSSGSLSPASQLKISWVPQTTDEVSGTIQSFAEQRQIDQTLFRSILRKLGFSREQFDIPLEQSSAGQKRKIQLAASLCESAHLFIWDEPLNYLDLEARIQLEQLLQSSDVSLLFVEHDPVFCAKIATHIIELQPSL